MTLFHFIRTSYNFQANLVLIKMGLYWPNFSLVFLIRLFLYAGVYCICGKFKHRLRRESFRFQQGAEIKRFILARTRFNLHFSPKILHILPPYDNCDIKNGRKRVKKVGQPWLTLTVQLLFLFAIFGCVSGQRTSCPPLSLSVLFSMFPDEDWAKTD